MSLFTLKPPFGFTEAQFAKYTPAQQRDLRRTSVQNGLAVNLLLVETLVGLLFPGKLSNVYCGALDLVHHPVQTTGDLFARLSTPLPRRRARGHGRVRTH